MQYFNVTPNVIYVGLGILPLDARTSGCAKFCVLSQYDVGKNIVIFHLKHFETLLFVELMQHQ